jgi:hypothetical protein
VIPEIILDAYRRGERIDPERAVEIAQRTRPTRPFEVER